MIHILVSAVRAVALTGIVSSSLYYLLCLWSARVFILERESDRRAIQFSPLPPVSILKPLKGIDPEIYRSFRSHCEQDYDDFEIIFGVSDADDPAIASVKALQQEFPHRNIRLLICSENLGANVKVSNLSQMLQAARFDYLIVNDSDIRVTSDYIRRVIAPLSDGNVGMVTCLYRGIAAETLGSCLESLGISTDFTPGVLIARQIERGIRFGLGSTLAFRRADLEKIGGFLVIVDYLADDYELGRRVAALGLSIRLSDVVVDTFLPAYGLRGFFLHQLRWARGVRDARASGYLGLIFTFGLFWALLALILNLGALWPWIALGLIFFLRLAVALVVGQGVLGDRQVSRFLWLVPLREMVGVAVWIASLLGRTVHWRGDDFVLRNGKLKRVNR